MIEIKKTPEDDSDISTDEHEDLNMTIKRLNRDRSRLPEIYKEGQVSLKQSILARLVDGVNSRYALRKDMSLFK